MNNEYLSQAIADAKSIREAALANARLTLLEQFDSKVTRVLADKLKEDIGDEENPDINVPSADNQQVDVDQNQEQNQEEDTEDVAGNVNITATDDEGQPLAVNNVPPAEDDVSTKADLPTTDLETSDINTEPQDQSDENETLNADELEEILNELMNEEDSVEDETSDVFNEEECDDENDCSTEEKDDLDDWFAEDDDEDETNEDHVFEADELNEEEKDDDLEDDDVDIDFDNLEDDDNDDVDDEAAKQKELENIKQKIVDAKLDKGALKRLVRDITSDVYDDAFDDEFPDEDGLKGKSSLYGYDDEGKYYDHGSLHRSHRKTKEYFDDYPEVAVSEGKRSKKSKQIAEDEICIDKLLEEINEKMNAEQISENKKRSQKNQNKKNINEMKENNLVTLAEVSEALLLAHRHNSKLKKSLNEHATTIKTLKEMLQEIKLLNSKLLYTNNLFRNKSLTENQKLKIINTFDLAKTEREVKLAYTVLAESIVGDSVVKKKKKNTTVSTITEGLASKPIASTKPSNKLIMENDDAVSRFQVLAGIKKPE